MGRPDIRQKKWGDQTSDKKNGEMRRKTKKWGDKTRNKKRGKREARQKKMER